MAEGVVKRYNAEKGFGFIEPDGGGSEIFVHATGVTEGATLLAGQRVRYSGSRRDGTATICCGLPACGTRP
jgi:cold shock protein